MYEVKYQVPSVMVYCHLRSAAKLSAKTPEAAKDGLKGTIFAVQITLGDDAVGMGRLIGDGGCFYQIVDITVLPEHQGQGLGKRIMQEIMIYIENNVPQSAYVSLIADGKAADLYAQFGFRATAPESIGMAIKVS